MAKQFKQSDNYKSGRHWHAEKHFVMKNLEKIQIKSVCKLKDGSLADLPARMALCAPDFRSAIADIKNEVEMRGGELLLSDLFRTHDMQHQAHLEYLKGRKAYCSPAGSGLHEAGRSMDIDVNAIKMSLKDFWEIAEKYGVTPIISKPSKGLSECWHFDKAGSHRIVYDYYASKKGTNMRPYTAMAVSGILACGIEVDTNMQGDQDWLHGRNTEAFIQSALIRLGYIIGNIDGDIGVRTKYALEKEGLMITDPEMIAGALENSLKDRYHEEFC